MKDMDAMGWTVPSNPMSPEWSMKIRPRLDAPVYLPPNVDTWLQDKCKEGLDVVESAKIDAVVEDVIDDVLGNIVAK